MRLANERYILGAAGVCVCVCVNAHFGLLYSTQYDNLLRSPLLKYVGNLSEFGPRG